MKERIKMRAIALYLPQYHPIPENDKYWGKGFTEWTNVAKAKPLFRGHQQPRIPTVTGFYDLRLPEVRKLQAELAKDAGIEGFCYWHYWFGNGKEVLQMPFDEVVKSKEPDFPFCLGWALHDWTTKTWEKGKNFSKDKIIFKQTFPGEQDDIQHFYRLLNAFKDKRYIKVDGKLLFLILVPELLPNPKKFMDTWNELAKKNGLNGFHFVAGVQVLPELSINDFNALDKKVLSTIDHYRNLGFDAVETLNSKYAEIHAKGKLNKMFHATLRKLFPGLIIDKFSYKKIVDNWFTSFDSRDDVYPQIMAGWDRSPRAGRNAVIYYDDTPEQFGKLLDKTLKVISNKSDQHKIVFINSWNEWGEGAYLEPDTRYGTAKLDELKKRLKNN